MHGQRQKWLMEHGTKPFRKMQREPPPSSKTRRAVFSEISYLTQPESVTFFTNRKQALFRHLLLGPPPVSLRSGPFLLERVAPDWRKSLAPVQSI